MKRKPPPPKPKPCKKEEEHYEVTPYLGNELSDIENEQ